jgi:hypothetical protein
MAKDDAATSHAMNSWLPGALGIGVLTIVVLALLRFVGSRRLLQSPKPSTPLSAVGEGWRVLFTLANAWPWVAVLIFVLKLGQILGYSARTLLNRPSAAILFWSGIAIDLLFTLCWAALAFQIYLWLLAPGLARGESRRRTRRAVLYALAFWAIGIAIMAAGVLWALLSHGRGRLPVAFVVIYFPYICILLAALTRPAIAAGVPKPFKECRRIISENWLGIAVTLLIAALPLGLVFYGVDLLRATLHPPRAMALILEVPIALVSALCYAAFEGAVASIYRRVY